MWTASFVLLGAFAFVASCSTVNSPGDPLGPSTGGSGPTTSTSTSTTGTGASGLGGGTGATGGGGGGGAGATGGSGGSPSCSMPEDCPLPNTVCLRRACIDGECATEPVPAETTCEPELYCSTGDICSQGICQPGPGLTCTSADPCIVAGCDEGGKQCTETPVTLCGPAEGCCPPGCTPSNDPDCLYWLPGVQQNVPEGALSGWTLCHSSTYVQSSLLSTLLAACSGSKLLLACRPVGAPTYTLLAMGNRADVLWDCGDSESCVHQANGVGWYYSSEYSWGFAPGGQPVNRFSCDYNAGNQSVPELRMCWHTGGSAVQEGYRCGDNDLNDGSGWQRVVYHAP